MQEKICSKCEIPKPFDDFNKHQMNKSGYRSYCKSCEHKYNTEYQKNYVRAPEIRFACPQSVQDQLYNIIDNLGIEKTVFFKMKMREIANSYPDKMKLPKPKN